MEKGVELYLVGDDSIRYRGPEAVLTPAYIEEIRRDKKQLIQELMREESPHDLTLHPFSSDVRVLLAWATELSEQDLVLTAHVSYLEVPRRTITTERVSFYATHYLRTITSARIGQHAGGWGMFNGQWHKEREIEAITALAALRDAIKGLPREKGPDG